MRLLAGRWSLRRRLVAASVLAGLMFAGVFGALATWQVSRVSDSAIDNALRTRLDVVRSEVAADGALSLDRRSLARAGLVQVLDPHGTVVSASPALAGLPPLVPLARLTGAGARGVRVSKALQSPDLDIALVSVPVRIGSGSGSLTVGVDTEAYVSTQGRVRELLVAGLLGAVVLLVVATWLLTGRALRVVAHVTEEAEAISGSDHGRLLPTPAGDSELARLVAALNSMLSRLHDTYARDVAFAGDASHRLRTPLATLRAEAELGVDGDPDQMREALVRVVADADHLAGLLDRMLVAVSPHAASPAVGLADAAEALRQRWTRAAAAQGVLLQSTLTGEVLVRPSSLESVLDPLIENAVRHTHPGGVIAVDWTVDGTDVVATVCNAGDGVPDRLQSCLFDPWVSSRSGSAAGGLGLWLAREAARSEGGDVWLVDPTPAMTTFRARLPSIWSGAGQVA